MPYAVIESGTVVNAIVADEEFAAQIGAVPIPDGFRIGDLYIDGEFIRVEPDDPEVAPMGESDADKIRALESEIERLAEQITQMAAQQAAMVKEANDAEH